MSDKFFVVTALSVTLFSGYALADNNSAGGAINFSGAITDTTCTINGGKSADFTVVLNPISVSDAGTTVGPITKNKKSFSLTFSGCTGASTTTNNKTPLKMYFSSAQNISTDGKYLINTTVNENDPAVALNVGFSLAKPGAATPILLNQPFDTGVLGNKTAPDAETITLDVYYYKTNALAARVGSLSSNLTYTISYL
ncbi:fimbrial protein [Intestinirhabdus alba]|jgi:major type 1 subunit fimbrin (pilin)|uniref:Type 1 fimbrial protein n=1 Tax=Intestinirhabdus alba TaxID=2899544 RepID=A0A6L6IQ35_9ENTR|nr:fimbrial protein [Intestinirhabdus alba]MTH47818.1 type 1 fimbrial protein [Intestinirhabdus alba]